VGRTHKLGEKIKSKQKCPALSINASVRLEFSGTGLSFWPGFKLRFVGKTVRRMFRLVFETKNGSDELVFFFNKPIDAFFVEGRQDQRKKK